MKQFLDSKGNPLEVGHEYALVTFGDYGMTPNPADEWINGPPDTKAKRAS